MIFFRNAKCKNGKPYPQAVTSGFSNLKHRLKSCLGLNFKKLFLQYKKTCKRTFQAFVFVNDHDQHVFDLMEWAIVRNQPLPEIDNEITRRLLKNQGIFSKSIQKYILNLNAIVEKKVSSEIPDLFGMMFVGWTDFRTHFFAIFPTYNVNSRFHETLTVLALPLKEEDLGANQNLEFLKITLGFFKK